MKRKNSELSWGTVLRSAGWLSITVALVVLSSTSSLSLTENTDVNSKTAIWKGPGGKPLPFQSHEEIKEFLALKQGKKGEPAAKAMLLPVPEVDNLGDTNTYRVGMEHWGRVFFMSL